MQNNDDENYTKDRTQALSALLPMRFNVTDDLLGLCVLLFYSLRAFVLIRPSLIIGAQQLIVFGKMRWRRKLQNVVILPGI